MVTWHSSRLSPKPVAVTTHSLFPAEHQAQKGFLPSPFVSCCFWSPCCEEHGDRSVHPTPGCGTAHSSSRPSQGHSELTAPIPSWENQGGFPTWAQLSPPLTSHASRIIPRDFLQCLCDFLWPLGVHSQGLKNTVIAGTFPEVQVPLIPHRIPAIPRKLSPAEPMEAPLPGSPE